MVVVKTQWQLHLHGQKRGFKGFVDLPSRGFITGGYTLGSVVMASQSRDDGADLFPITRKLVFFNHAGVAPISGPAATAIRRYADQAESAAYCGSGWYEQVGRIKATAAGLIGAASGDEVAFVANTSTGLNMVANGLDWRAGDQVVITNVEYPANRYPWENLKRLGVELVEVQQKPDGRIDVREVVGAITQRTRVVSISHVQYASGFRINLSPISEAVHRVGGCLCVDAIQSVGVLPVDVQETGIDFLAADGHKWLLSPEGCGLFYCRRELIGSLHPCVVGWMNMVDSSNYGDYRFELEPTAKRFEPGSYNIPGIMALGASVDLLLSFGIDRVWSQLEQLTARLCQGLDQKGYRVFSPRRAGERSGIVVFEPPDDGRRSMPPLHGVVAGLQKKGIVIVVREGRLRASPHFYNTPVQIDQLVDALP